ncbi:hypothetical protein FG05_35004 [Fusarium graminearum]|nr:hypothetical protein FG05_35004 [Fusarium graminearum]
MIADLYEATMSHSVSVSSLVRKPL